MHKVLSAAWIKARHRKCYWRPPGCIVIDHYSGILILNSLMFSYSITILRPYWWIFCHLLNILLAYPAIVVLNMVLSSIPYSHVLPCTKFCNFFLPNIVWSSKCFEVFLINTPPYSCPLNLWSGGEHSGSWSISNTATAYSVYSEY